MPLPHRGRVREASAEPVLWISARRDRGLWTSGPLVARRRPGWTQGQRRPRHMFSRAHYWMLARTEQLSKLLAVTERWLGAHQE